MRFSKSPRFFFQSKLNFHPGNVSIVGIMILSSGFQFFPIFSIFHFTSVNHEILETQESHTNPKLAQHLLMLNLRRTVSASVSY